MPRKHGATFQRIAPDAADLDVRLSTAPDVMRWIVYRVSTGSGVASPYCTGVDHGPTTRCGCWHDSEQAALDAIPEYLEAAQREQRQRKPRSALVQSAPRQSRTLAEELRALRKWVAENDANPFTHLPKRLHLYTDKHGIDHYTRS